MKKILSGIILIMAFCQCNNGADKGGAKDQRPFQPGDRAGADTGMTDVSDSRLVPKLLCQRWDNKEDYEDVKGGSDVLRIPFRGFYLFSDGSVVKNPRDNMAFGRWAYDAERKMLQLTLQNGTIERYVIQDIRYNELLMSTAGEKGKITEYMADGFVQKELVNDPFYALNMQWRIKPGAREDEAALRKRLRGCLHFYYLYYNDNIKRNASVVYFYGLPGCFNWYAGGIHLKHEDKLDKEWNNIFYDASDASKAYIILDKMISKKYNWNQEERNWVKQNADVLKQMEEKIDSL